MRSVLLRIGQRFGRLKIQQRIPNFNRHTAYICVCDCGKLISITVDYLRAGTKSCGCIQREASRKNLSRLKTKHGMANTPIYYCWGNMKDRCLNSNSQAYDSYGGRGIKIDPQWMTFEGFYKDMGSTFKRGLTIERIDVNGNYEKGNCKWATRSEQQRNRRPSSEWKNYRQLTSQQ